MLQSGTSGTRSKALRAAMVAATLLASAANASDNPDSAAAAAPVDGAALVELVECHAATAERLHETAARLGAQARWTFAHQTLAVETDRHDRVGSLLFERLDREAYRAILAAYFPDGPNAGDSAVRVDRWTRCVRLYGRIDTFVRERAAEADAAN